MTSIEQHSTHPDSPLKSVSQVGLYSAVLTTVITLITFGFAIIAVPVSGANCLEGCIDYPYLDTVSQFPKDYRWMIPAIILMLVYMVLAVSVQAYASREKKIFGQIGLVFALMSGLILVSDYFLQFSVVPISLMSGETEGITLLTQYNAHGIFIALEELGYLMMALSFIFMAPVFMGKNGLEKAIRWVFITGFVLALVSFIAFSAIYGLDRQDRFEVLVISIDWLVLVINGILLSLLFNRHLKKTGTA